MGFSWRRIGIALLVAFACAVGLALYCRSMPSLPNGYALAHSWDVPGEIVVLGPERYLTVSRLGHVGVAVDGHVAGVAVEGGRFIVVDQRLARGRKQTGSGRYFLIDSVGHTISGPLSADEIGMSLGKPLTGLRFRRVSCGG